MLEKSKSKSIFSTFRISGQLCGLEVDRVQEVVKSIPLTSIPLTADFVKGLINLRGQVVTAIGIRELLGFGGSPQSELMNVICKSKSGLISFLVDDIGDVIELEESTKEGTPNTIPKELKSCVSSVYKLENDILVVLDFDSVMDMINFKNEN